MSQLLQDPRILSIIALPEDRDESWKADLARLEAGDLTLDRKTAGENSIKIIQRLLIFLGYSTAGRGGFLVDGDFGRGTNRGVAQFQFEHGLNPVITRAVLCYECNWRNAHQLITAIPDARLDLPTLTKMVQVALQNIDEGKVYCGDFDEAIFQLNSLHQRRFYSTRQIFERYGPAVEVAVKRLADEHGATVHPLWLFTIIKQESAGVVRPRFEQHYLSRLNRANPQADLAALRYRSMSFGLGQIMGENFGRIGLDSAQAMYTSTVEEQIFHIGRFLITSTAAGLRTILTKASPTSADFHVVARAYNGPDYARHFYHEKIERGHREFRALL
jgi:peptidoglycan hydrolase-like protein with peptidoglycan-binding domain